MADKSSIHFWAIFTTRNAAVPESRLTPARAGIMTTGVVHTDVQGMQVVLDTTRRVLAKRDRSHTKGEAALSLVVSPFFSNITTADTWIAENFDPGKGDRFAELCTGEFSASTRNDR